MYAQHSNHTYVRSYISKGAISPVGIHAPRTVATVRAAASVFLIVFGAVLCANGYPQGIALFAAAAVNMVFAYLLVTRRNDR
jgi:hypothetical protein